jgi:CDP-diacylglycerol--serine O-phosphatidyltransferase
MNVTILNPYFLLVLTVVSCYLLNAPIKLFSLKFKSGGFAKNASRYIFLALCVVTLAVFQFAAIPVIIAIYIGMSVLDNISAKKNGI